MSGQPYRPLDYLDHSSISPSGRVSKRARKQAAARLSAQLWPDGCSKEDICGKAPEPTPAENAEALRRYARTLRDLADKGVSPRKYLRKAEEMEVEALAIETGG